MQELILPEGKNEISVGVSAIPAIISDAGSSAEYAWSEFFLAKIRNTNTRRAYGLAVRRFLNWCENKNVTLNQITPAHVAGFLDEQNLSIPSKKLWLSAIRGLFDQLVLRHSVVINPALSVRGERYRAEGKTPEISREDTRTLLRSIDTNTIIGQRDRCIIAVLTYTAVRASAVAKLTVGDLLDHKFESTLRFQEKNGNERRIPARSDLTEMLREYLSVSGLEFAPKKHPMFPSTIGRSGNLTDRFLLGGDIARIVKRRLKAAKLPYCLLSPHSFRTAAITDLLEQSVPLSDVQRLAGHADPRITQLYDRRQTKVTRNVVERISV